jgi:hypothetical protein
VGKQLVAGLLAQHLAQQHAQRAHIAAQGRFFQVAGLRFQLRQPLRPALGIPQKGHRLLIMHEGPHARAPAACPSARSAYGRLRGKATELPDGAIPNAKQNGNFIMGPTHTPRRNWPIPIAHSTGRSSSSP